FIHRPTTQPTTPIELFSGYIYDIITKNFYDFKSFYTFVAMKKGLARTCRQSGVAHRAEEPQQ
ncbi:MAG: hypothetical protein IIU94_05305, partial [Alistipes sp.]|nr:hypothetical protein [Alistipes sp.]